MTLARPPQNSPRDVATPSSTGPGPVMVACPDARPPAYQAVVGLTRARLLHSFVTASYYSGRGAIPALAKRVLPARYGRWERILRRRHNPEIPPDQVRAHWGYDVALAVENRLGPHRARSRRRVARGRTRAFDRALARTVARERPELLFAFSDVASEHTLPLCRQLGIPTILSMVCGDPREELLVLDREANLEPEFFPLYLGDAAIDREALRWLHDRRLRDLELADRILVPSAHLAHTLIGHGTPADKIAMVPYSADTTRFVPDPHKRPSRECTFLFAGGISQRKGIKYLLEAWRRVRRPGWRLQLLGALPRVLGPLERYLDEVEVLGRVGHADMPARMAAADVFVFPSLFEGSAVVTYEALACGLPCIVTPAAGSVVREGHDGFVVPPRNVEALAARMELLGSSPLVRADLAASARARAEAFDWTRYHTELVCEIFQLRRQFSNAEADGSAA